MQVGSRIDMPLLDIELGHGAQWFSSRTTGAWSETTPGASVGNIDFTAVQATVGSVTIPLFDSGGSGFSISNIQSGYGAPLGLLANTVSDSFNRANAATLGTSWTAQSGAFDTSTFKINTLTAAVTGAVQQAASYYNAVGFAADQCSQVTVSGSTGALYGGPSVRNAAGDNYYTLSTSPGAVSGTSLQKVVSGTRTILWTDTGVTFTSPINLKLCIQGTSLTAYVNTNLVETITDSSLASGAPGIAGYNSGIGLTNWIGTNFIATVDTGGNGVPTGCNTSYGIGSTYRRLDGGTNTTFYVCEGGGSPAWVAK
jgi:hypothetical protein